VQLPYLCSVTDRFLLC